MKQCIKCKLELELIQFHKNKYRKDGYQNWCKECNKIATYNIRKKHPERNLLSQRRTTQARLDKGLCQSCTKERLPYSKRYCEFHFVASKAKFHFGTGSNSTTSKLIQLLEQQNRKCPYTGEELILGFNAEIDHIYPRSRFPEKVKDLDNVEWVSSKANLSKSNMTKEEFINFCQQVIDFAGSQAHGEKTATLLGASLVEQVLS